MYVANKTVFANSLHHVGFKVSLAMVKSSSTTRAWIEQARIALHDRPAATQC
jgi:hypothetical protein